jgi:hypothetical protein
MAPTSGFPARFRKATGGPLTATLPVGSLAWDRRSLLGYE